MLMNDYFWALPSSKPPVACLFLISSCEPTNRAIPFAKGQPALKRIAARISRRPTMFTCSNSASPRLLLSTTRFVP